METAESRVYAEDSIYETAYKIFHNFEVMQNCSVVGWAYSMGKTVKKGELVLDELRKLDIVHNCTTDSNGKIRRKRTIKPNTIGGFVAQKAFKFNSVMIDNEPKITIWRIQ